MKALDKVIFLQCCSWLVVSGLFWIFGGTTSGVSAFFGGAACALPTLLVILTIKLVPAMYISPIAIFVYEFIKVAGTILGLLLVVLFYKELEWPPFLVSSGVVLNSLLVAMAFRR